MDIPQLFLILILLIGLFAIVVLGLGVAAIIYFLRRDDEAELKEYQKLLLDLNEVSQWIENKKNYLMANEKKSSLLLIQKIRNTKIHETGFRKILSRFLPKNPSVEKIREDFILTCGETTSKIENYTYNFISQEITNYPELWKEKNFELDYNQKCAIIKDDETNLVIAGAGAGKTEVLTKRIVYLATRKEDQINPDKILALAFQRKAATEIENRLSKKYGIERVDVRTFHSLGYKILRTNGEQISLLNNSDVEDDSGYTKLIKEIVNNFLKDNSFSEEALFFISNIKDDIDANSNNRSPNEESYYTLDGEKLRSLAEKHLYNFFLSHKLNGKKIKIEYESEAKWMNYTSKNGYKPKPDFYFPEFKIYLEHWAIDEDGNVPDWFSKSSEEYKYEMNKKKSEFSKNKEFNLIETTNGDFKKGELLQKAEKDFLRVLSDKYPGRQFKFEKMTFEELNHIFDIENQNTAKNLDLLIANFIKNAKVRGRTPEIILKEMKKTELMPSQKAFTAIAVKVYREYNEKLKAMGKIDFEDMINNATVALQNNNALFQNKFEHILVDEYQDMNQERYKLLRALLDKNPGCKLFCVGDDWQSIMGFTGSHPKYFVKFSNYFKSPEVTTLDINYRSVKTIVDAGNELISFNKDPQINKEVIAANPDNENSGIEIIKSSQFTNQIDQLVQEIISLNKNGIKANEMTILFRIKNPRDIKEIIHKMKQNKIILNKEQSGPGVLLTSVHRVKG